MDSPIRFSCDAAMAGFGGRAGRISTPHGVIETPAFVVVGTKATVKSITPEILKSEIGAQVMLANAYHLFLQPGHELIKEAGGLHAFSHWNGPTMTDSGGFQVFSLGDAFERGVNSPAAKKIETEPDLRPNVYSEEEASKHGKLCVIDDDGATFTSHIDGSLHRFTAERSIEIQHAIGADIIVAFDECTSATADRAYQEKALDRTHAWAKRSIIAHKGNFEAVKSQGLFGVVQGGRHEDLRKKSAETLAAMDFDGYGIGGSFSKEDLGGLVKLVTDILPKEKPRHLLGIGEPEDIFMGVENGCDTFDCVAPTRLGRTGALYTSRGKINIMQSKYRTDLTKPDHACACYTCTNYTSAYLSHLFRAKEMLGPHLASIHNLYFIVNFVKGIRESILNDTYAEYKESFMREYRSGS